jgi:hypothetical protein
MGRLPTAALRRLRGAGPFPIGKVVSVTVLFVLAMVATAIVFMLPIPFAARPSNVSVTESMPGLSSGPAPGISDNLVGGSSDDLPMKELRFAGSIDASEPMTYRPGETIDFKRGGNSRAYVSTGWSVEEDAGTWSDDEEAILRLKLDPPYKASMELVVMALAFVSHEHPKESVAVVANGELIANWTFQDGQSWTEWRAQIPAEVVQSNIIKLSFRISDPISPKNLGLSPDTRKLGIMVQQLRINKPQ